MFFEQGQIAVHRCSKYVRMCRLTRVPPVLLYLRIGLIYLKSVSSLFYFVNKKPGIIPISARNFSLSAIPAKESLPDWDSIFYPPFSILNFLEFFRKGWKISAFYGIMRLSIP